MNTQQEYYSVKEAATIMGCPEQTIYTKIRRRQIPAVKHKNRILIHRTFVNQIIANKQEPNAEV